MRDLGDYEALGRKTNRDPTRLATEIPNPVSDLTYYIGSIFIKFSPVNGRQGFCWINFISLELSLHDVTMFVHLRGL